MHQEKIEQIILRYVSEREDSADTLEGIVTWWIMRESIDQKIAEARAAIDHLVDAGVLIESVTAGSRITYRVNKHPVADNSATNPVHRASDRVV